MNSAHGLLLASQLGVELRERAGTRCPAVSEHAGEPVAIRGCARHSVHLALVSELEPVLDPPEESVRGCQRVGVAPADVPRVRKLIEHGQRGR